MPHAKSPPFWQHACAELSAADATLARIIAAYQGECLQGKDDAFLTLLRSITGQQISVKAADSIWARLENQLPVASRQSLVKPKTVAALDDEALRSCGYSRQKISYIRSLCQFFLTRQHLERDWAEMSDEDVIRDLTQIKGIGRWTAEMFLIFHLLRPNVFPVDDLGVLKAMRTHYSLNGAVTAPNPTALAASPCSDGWTKSDYLRLAEIWQPWRSVATWYLWRSLDPVPVAY